MAVMLDMSFPATERRKILKVDGKGDPSRRHYHWRVEEGHTAQLSLEDFAARNRDNRGCPKGATSPANAA
jgi:hypothetical protein